MNLINSGEKRVVVCPFSIRKESRAAVSIKNDVEILCKRELGGNDVCIIDGRGTVFKIEGNTKVSISGFLFRESDSTAIRVLTNNLAAVTTICQCGFQFNKRAERHDGGAIFASHRSGTVIIVKTLFWDNYAERAGAIWSESKRLTILDSTFSLNTAKVCLDRMP